MNGPVSPRVWLFPCFECGRRLCRWYQSKCVACKRHETYVRNGLALVDELEIREDAEP